MTDPDFVYGSYPIIVAILIVLGFIGLGLFYYAGDILEQIKKTFIFYFVSEKIDLKGIIVEFGEEKIPFSSLNYSNSNNYTFGFDPKRKPLCYSYVKVWRPIENDYYTLEVKYSKFLKAQKRASKLNFFISLKCKKYAYSDELFVY